MEVKEYGEEPEKEEETFYLPPEVG